MLGFSPVWILMCVLREDAWAVEKSHWLHFFCFSPVCILMCLSRAVAQTDENEHWLHLWDLISDLVAFELSSSVAVFSMSPLFYCLCVQLMTEEISNKKSESTEELNSSKKRKYWMKISNSSNLESCDKVLYTLTHLSLSRTLIFIIVILQTTSWGPQPRASSRREAKQWESKPQPLSILIFITECSSDCCHHLYLHHRHNHLHHDCLWIHCQMKE